MRVTLLLLLLLLLSRFSCVRLCATPEMAAHQAPLPLGFSRQEHCLESNLGYIQTATRGFKERDHPLKKINCYCTVRDFKI